MSTGDECVEVMVMKRQLWHPAAGIPGDLPLCLRSRPQLPRPSSQGAKAGFFRVLPVTIFVAALVIPFQMSPSFTPSIKAATKMAAGRSRKNRFMTMTSTHSFQRLQQGARRLATLAARLCTQPGFRPRVGGVAARPQDFDCRRRGRRDWRLGGPGCRDRGSNRLGQTVGQRIAALDQIGQVVP